MSFELAIKKAVDNLDKASINFEASLKVQRDSK